MGAPLSQTSLDFADEAWLPFDEIPQLAKAKESVSITQGTAQRLRIEENTLDYVDPTGTRKSIGYDYAVVATGLRREWPVAPRALDKKNFMRDTSAQLARFSKARVIAVIGGGTLFYEARYISLNLLTRPQVRLARKWLQS
jgi:NADH dehydrogenase FAD-containing subunit